MDLHQLRTFVAIAETGGVARAAARLNLSQPAASRQIQVLEADLGVQLFDRVGRRVKLTAAARTCCPGRAGSNPELEQGEVHVAYVPAGDDRFCGRLLYPIHVIAVVPERHRLHGQRTLEIAELAREPLLCCGAALDRANGSMRRAVRRASAPTSYSRAARTTRWSALRRPATGIGVLPSAVRLAGRRLCAVPLVHRGEPIGRWTMLAWDPQRFLAPYARAFVDELVTHAQRTYPGRELARRAPPLDAPKERLS